MFKFIALFVVFGLVACDHIDHDAEVKSFKNDLSPDGSFVYGFEASNGISVQAAGSAAAITGSVAYTSPEGTPIKLSYVADENGYQPIGDHLPVAPEGPEIPAHILRALEYIRAHPPKE